MEHKFELETIQASYSDRNAYWFLETEPGENQITIAVDLTELDARNIVEACNAYPALFQRNIELVEALRAVQRWLDDPRSCDDPAELVQDTLDDTKDHK